MIDFSCSHCKGRMQAADDSLGYYAICPHCNQEVLVGNSSTNTTTPEKSIEQQLDIEMRSEDGGTKTALLLFIISTLIYVGFYAAFLEWINPASMVYRLLAIGWVPYVVVFLTILSMAMLIHRLYSIHYSMNALGETYLSHSTPLNTDVEIDESMLMIRDKAKLINDTNVAKRIVSALSRFKHTHSIREAEDILKASTERAFNEMEAGYTILRVIVWAVPILGFIGTVQGVGASVGGLAGVLGKEVEDISQITNALANVTKDLSFAFDTTLIALIATVIIMIAMSLVERLDYSSLDRIEDYVNQQVLLNLPIKVGALQAGQKTEL